MQKIFKTKQQTLTSSRSIYASHIKDAWLIWFYPEVRRVTVHTTDGSLQPDLDVNQVFATSLWFWFLPPSLEGLESTFPL